MKEFIFQYPVEDISGEKVTLSSHANPIERKEFYQNEIDRHLKGLDPQFAVEIINILLCDPEKEQFLIQKRAETKSHNPGLYDKTIGGHLQVLPNNTAMETALFESLEELRIPCYAFNNDDAFCRGYEKFNSLLEHVAIIKQLDTKPLIYKRLMKIGDENELSTIDIAGKVHVFFGSYSGPVKNTDGEAAGFSFMNMDTLKKELVKHPDMYTHDLKTLIDLYGEEISEEIKKMRLIT